MVDYESNHATDPSLDAKKLIAKMKSLETMLVGIDGTISQLEASMKLVATRMRRIATQQAEFQERLLKLENEVAGYKV